MTILEPRFRSPPAALRGDRRDRRIDNVVQRRLRARVTRRRPRQQCIRGRKDSTQYGHALVASRGRLLVVHHGPPRVECPEADLGVTFAQHTAQLGIALKQIVDCLDLRHDRPALLADPAPGESPVDLGRFRIARGTQGAACRYREDARTAFRRE
jgi:hypothetical protein